MQNAFARLVVHTAFKGLIHAGDAVVAFVLLRDSLLLIFYAENTGRVSLYLFSHVLWNFCLFIKFVRHTTCN